MGQGHAALGAAHRVFDLSLGRTARRPRRQGAWGFAVRQRLQPAGHGDLRHLPGDPQMDAADREADRRLRSGEPLLFARRERQGGDRHRLPPGWRRADPHPDPRPRPVAGPHRRAGAEADRDRDLPHAVHARPAAGAVAVGALAPHRGPACRADQPDARARTARQPGAARRTDRARRRARGRCSGQPLPLRRQPRL